jgi:toxin CcdB
MARFDVHENPSRRSRARVVYLLDIQADMLSDLATRLVVPLVPKTRHGPVAQRLNPVFKIGARRYVMATAEMAAIPRKHMGERVASLSAHSTEILNAIDFLVSGI